ncbi:MAG: DUF378 domain-containing protein [Patescibacteria group bacterium]
MKNLTSFDLIAFVLVVIGGINWGTIALFDLDLVRLLFGDMTPLSRIVYGLVGLSAVYLLFSALTATDSVNTRVHNNNNRTSVNG